ncbi:hypothetical protein AB0L41_42770 [Amycolatopsis mediterranei]|uniref:hypothetical protein n=1 Tax=Amycolatopsis mediterranei TaxID=33910 RepID=UPI003432014F
MTLMSRRFDGKPETAADTRFFDLRESGYRGSIDQDGYAVTSGRAKDILDHLAAIAAGVDS